MITAEISLDLKEKISDIYNRFGYKDSAHSFESMYIWREEMGLSFVYSDDFYSVQEASKGPYSWFFPVGSKDSKIEFISDQLDNGNLHFYYMTSDDVSFIEKHFPDQFTIREAPESSEYIMSRDIMENLPVVLFPRTEAILIRCFESTLLKQRASNLSPSQSFMIFLQNGMPANIYLKTFLIKLPTSALSSIWMFWI